MYAYIYRGCEVGVEEEEAKGNLKMQLNC